MLYVFLEVINLKCVNFLLFHFIGCVKIMTMTNCIDPSLNVISVGAALSRFI